MNVLDSIGAPARKARVEIIPLIDVIFFLLATFVLFTLSLNKISAINVPLPSGDIQPKGEPSTVYLQTTDEGMYFWKEGRDAHPDLISATELSPRLADYAQRVSQPRVFVRGDNRARFGAAVKALDAVRAAGIAQVSIETTPSPTGR